MSTRLVIGIGLVVVLAVVVFLVSQGGTQEPAGAPSIVVPTTPTTKPTTSLTTSSTEPATPSTTTLEQREAEVAAILQDLWFGWFDAIYQKDPDALWEVVATEEKHRAGVEAMNSDFFLSAPTVEGLGVELRQILLDRTDCLVTYASLDATQFRGTSATTTRVDVMWPAIDGSWRLATAWDAPGGSWILDCDVRNRGRE